MNTAMDEREEIEALLPWYVTGRLDAVEHRRVEAYLADHPDMAPLVILAREESEETIRSAEAFGTPSNASFDRLMAQVANEPRRAGVLSSLTPVFERIADWIASLSRPQLGAMAAAAALLLAVQAGVILHLASGPSKTQSYETASGDPAAVQEHGTFALVAFHPDATAVEIATLLTETEAQIIDGPKAGGIWRVRIAPEALPQAEAEQRLANFKSHSTIVGFASLTP
jgi:anti-sigma factor RsiW